MSAPADPPADPLPADVASCHALINRLAAELEETRRKLAAYVDSERREMEYRYGKGVTAADVLAFGQRFGGIRIRRGGGKT